MRNDNLFFIKKEVISDLNTSLIFYCSYNNNVNELVYGNNGTNFGTISYGSSIDNNAINYAGSGRYTSYPDSDNYSFTDGLGSDIPFSMNFWVNFNGSTGIMYFISKRPNPNQEYNIYGTVTGSDIAISVLLATPNGLNYITATSESKPINTGVWRMITITYNGNKLPTGIKVYLDGVILSTSTSSAGTYTGMGNGTAKLYTGNDPVNTSARYVLGLFDEMAMWKNRELNSLEIAALWNSGSGIFYPY